MEDSVGYSAFDFGGSIVGFEQLSRFALAEMEPNSPFYRLRSLEEESIEYIVVSPFEVCKEYEFQLGDDLKNELSVDRPDDVLVLSIVTLRKPFYRSTLNLLAPLVCNIRTGKGKQLILNGSAYAVNTPLFPPLQDRGE
ncbi:flagellar assembly protein FliW [Paenibacillus sp. GCM10023250]|uniref:flagellar assembly protein FliW n=1 Tax=Paenibacillus sp. GCM10023250 TaxID=3252648 RepID=UPI00361F6BB3